VQKKIEGKQFLCEFIQDEKVEGMPVSRNIIMKRLFVGIDVQTRRDCCFAISNDNGLLQESGWFGENHEQFLDLLKKLSAGSEVYIGIDAPRHLWLQLLSGNLSMEMARKSETETALARLYCHDQYLSH